MDRVKYRIFMGMHGTELHHRKQEIRKEATSRRRQQQNAERLSQQILARLVALPEYAHAATVMTYVDFRSEVHTRPLLTTAWQDGKRVVVSYCTPDKLELVRLETLDELAPGTLGIQEPCAELRSRPDRRVRVNELDLIVVPGLAFDRTCARIGYGKGYYDRLLRHARPAAAVVAVAFECQVFPEVPVLPYDVRVDMVVTETTIYRRTLPRWQEG
jgi:5-formyltetrahydrofolate cyclo-ligase